MKYDEIVQYSGLEKLVHPNKIHDKERKKKDTVPVPVLVPVLVLVLVLVLVCSKYH